MLARLPAVPLAVLGCLLALAARAGDAPITAALPSPQAVTERPDPMPHRAIYHMELVRARTGGDFADIEGRMRYEWAETCQSWSTDQKFTIDYVFQKGDSQTNSIHFSTVEAKDGSTYHIQVIRAQDGMETTNIRGWAERTGDGTLRVSYVRPEPAREIELPARVLLPTQHLMAMMDHAGKPPGAILNALAFDGSDGKGAVEVNLVYGPRVDAPAPAEGIDARLMTGQPRRLRLAYFPDDSRDALPDFEMTLDMLDNGIVTALRMDYPSYSIAGRLEALEPVPRPDC